MTKKVNPNCPLSCGHLVTKPMGDITYECSWYTLPADLPPQLLGSSKKRKKKYKPWGHSGPATKPRPLEKDTEGIPLKYKACLEKDTL